MHYACRYIPVPQTSSSFSKYWENEPDDSFLVSKRGHLFGYISIETNNSPNDLSQTASLIITQINQAYFTANNDSFKSHLKTCLDQITKDWSKDYKLSILLLAIHDQTLAIASYGQNYLSLVRKSKFTNLISTNNTNGNIISGSVYDQDLLFISHPDLITKIPDLGQFLDLNNLNAQEEFLKNQISDPPFASVLIEVHQSVTAAPILPPPVVDQLDTPRSPLLNPIPKKSLFLSLIKKISAPKPITINQKPVKYFQEKNKRNLILGTLAIIGLFSSLIIGYSKNSQKQKQQKFAELDVQVQTNLTNIDKVRQLNLEDAQVLANQTKTIIDQMSSLNIDQAKVDEYSAKINDILAQTGSADYTNPELYYDTTLITSNPNYSYISFLNKEIYLLDTTNGRIDSVAGKSNRQISSEPQTKQTTSLLYYKTILYAVSGDKLYRVAKKNWSASVDFKGVNPISSNLWGSSAYFLEPSGISKSNISDTSVASSSAWLASDQTFPDNPIGLAIDGKVWILSQNGLISVYLRGKKDNFTLSNPPQTNTASNLYLAQDKDLLLYLSDPKTVVVYTKTGQPLAKYSFKDLTILSITYSEADSLIYLLASDQKIYSLKI